MTTVSAHYTAADEPISKKQKQDDSDVLKFGKAGQIYKNFMLGQKLALFDYVCAQQAMEGISLGKALEPTCMNRTAYYEMKKNIDTIKSVVNNDPQLLHVCWPLTQILLTDADNSANKMEQEVTSNKNQRLAMEQTAAEQSFSRNAALISKVLLEDRKVSHTSIVVDLTNGEGQFTAKVRQWYKIVAVDKYKNRKLRPNDFAHVWSYDCQEFLELLESGGVLVAIYDPPYQTMIGGYNLHNSDWEKSQSRVNFNDRYGVSFPYTATMIHCFYLKGFQLADKLLASGGIFLVKLMNTNVHDDLRQAVLNLADSCGFKHDGDAYKVKSSNGEPSYLYVFVRRSPKDVSFADLYQGDQAHSQHEQIEVNVQLRAGDDYMKAGRKLVEKANKWIGYHKKLSHALNVNQRKLAVKDISPEITNSVSRFETAKEKYKSTFYEGAEISPNSWEELQTMCLEVNADLTAIITMTGLFFEQLLKAKRIDLGSINDKKKIEQETIGANVLVWDKSHTSLSNNIMRLRTQCKEDKQKRNLQLRMKIFLK